MLHGADAGDRAADIQRHWLHDPIHTTTIAITALRSMIGTSERMDVPWTEKPNMAMECITQIPVPPIATAAATSHPARYCSGSDRTPQPQQ